MRKFFQQFGMPNMPNGMPHGKQMITGEGSGFFISADGYAVTNNHVVDHAKTVQIKTADGETYKAKVIGTDPQDRPGADQGRRRQDASLTSKFADKAPRVGDWVVAVGNPFGLSETVTAGIVSAYGRDIGAGTYDDYIQIDAPINKGNSGGPAFNTEGNVIGVNTAIYSPSGGSVGIGFDIPAPTAKLVVAQLKAHGYVNHAFLGVQVQPVSAGIADSLGLKQAKGALVDEPMPGSPAAKAGIKAGDVITAVNGKSIKDSRDLARTIGMMAPGSKVKVELVQNGEVKTLDVTLAKLPDEQSAKADNGTREAGRQRPAASRPHAGAGQRGRGRRRQGRRRAQRRSRRPGRGARPARPATSSSTSAANPSPRSDDVRSALREAHSSGKHDVLMRVKSRRRHALRRGAGRQGLTRRALKNAETQGGITGRAARPVPLCGRGPAPKPPAAPLRLAGPRPVF